MGFNENEPNVAQRCAAAGICQSQQATRHCCVHAHNRFSLEVWSEIACVRTTKHTDRRTQHQQRARRGRAGVTWGVMTSTVGILLYCHVLSCHTHHRHRTRCRSVHPHAIQYLPLILRFFVHGNSYY